MASKLRRTLRTFTFKLTLVYVGLFALSVVILFAFIYTFSISYVRDQVADAVKGQYQYLHIAHEEGGAEGVALVIDQLIADDPEGTEIYLLITGDGEKIAGNLNIWPDDAETLDPFNTKGNWVRFQIQDTRDEDSGIEVNAISTPISDSLRLLVGQSSVNISKIEHTVTTTFWASLALSFIMALSGAAIMTRSVTRRINVINNSAGQVMRGKLSVRFPFNEAGDEFDELSMNLNKMLDTIENLLESLSQFSNNIAHDLRSPLTRIIGRMDAGLRELDEESPVYSLMEKNIADAQHLVDTFNSILNISDLEANPDLRVTEPCDLHEILEKVVEFYEPLATEKGITFTYENTEPAVIYGEKRLLAQAFANVLDNAIKFTPNNGAVEVDIVRSDNYITVSIADSGPGVPVEKRDKIFDKFVRLEQSRNTTGNGLGLSMVSAVARIHDAAITLDDHAPGLIVNLHFIREK